MKKPLGAGMQQVWELMPAEVVYRETKTEVIMGNESGTWIVREATSQRLSSLENLATAATEKRSFEVYGVSEDAPKCIHTVEQAIEYINEIGFLPCNYEGTE